MAAFKVRKFETAPDYESLHVAKITDFPLEKRDYKPYSQARICFSSEGLHVQLLSFEASPLAESKMTAIFQFESEQILLLSLAADLEVHAAVQSSNTSSPLSPVVHTFDGEDLQGVYWGGNLQLPYAQLESFWGAFSPTSGAEFKGNFYKTCEKPPKVHCGSFYPTNFAQPLTDPSNWGTFTVIEY